MFDDSAAALVTDALAHCDAMPVAADSVAAVRTWAARLPGSYPCDSGLLELDLADPTTLDVSLMPRWGGPLPANASPELHRIADVFDHVEQCAPGNASCTRLREAWAEYDIAGDGLAPQAAVFIGIEPAHRQDWPLVAQVASMLRGVPLPVAALDHVRQGYALGEGHLQIGYVAAMPGRAGNPVRLNIGGPRANQLALPAARAAITPALEPVLSAADNLVTCIDVRDEDIGARWGLELVVRRGSGMLARTRELLGHLREAGLLDADALEALQRWNGGRALPHAPVVAARRLTGDPGMLYAWRTINHLKLVIAPGRPIGLKAYLGFGRRWIPDALRRAAA